MKLQANHKGAWQNVPLPVGITQDMGLPEDERLKRLSDRLCAGSRGRRIVRDQTVLWLWNAEHGWHRPRWWKGCP